jgi:stage II sporulation protein AA (anti-sigma F factor antagonist)
MSSEPNSVLEVQTSGRAIVAVVNRSDLSHDTSQTFQKQLDAAIAAAPGASVVLDLAKVEFVPSLALGILVAANKRLQQDGRRLILVGVRPEVLEIIKLTGLLRVFDVNPDREDAIRQLA